MTEAEWLKSGDVAAMQEDILRTRLDNQRKDRLFLVACCRRVAHLLRNNRARRVIDAVERHAEGMMSREALATTVTGVWDGLRADADDYAGTAVIYASLGTEGAAIYAAMSLNQGDREAELGRAERAIQSDLLRCIFGNPFRPVQLDPAWLAWKNHA